MIDDLPNLVSPLLGSKIVFATDEWFASAGVLLLSVKIRFRSLTIYFLLLLSDNMIQDTEPVWKQDLYTSYGKWMDGWESRRRRTEGHDWCIIQLGQLIDDTPRTCDASNAILFIYINLYIIIYHYTFIAPSYYIYLPQVSLELYTQLKSILLSSQAISHLK